jgi:crotonobetainyl-CoA:carnitine CoA-transferase CaiB-like acyl-CoA transferase
MTDGSLSWLAMVAGQYLCDGIVPKRGDPPLAGRIICYRPYEAKDGWVSCGALEQKFWAAWCKGVDREDLIPHQFDAPGSDAHQQAQEIFRSRTRAEWKAFNDERDCCIEPILDMDEVLESDQVRERGMVVSYEQPQLGEVRQLGFPIKMSRTPAEVHRHAPALGEHTAEVLGEAGMSEEQVAALISSGAAKGSDAEVERGPAFLA